MSSTPVASTDELADALSKPLGWRCVSGVLRTRHHDGTWYEQQIYMSGDMYRVENGEFFGHSTFVRGASHYWVRSDMEDSDYEFGAEGPHHDHAGGLLARRETRRYWAEWISADPRLVMSTMVATTFLGREACRFTMPEIKGGNPIMTMDLETGIVLRTERDDMGVFGEWLSFSTEPLDGSMFDLSDAL